jgi:surface protein
MTEVKLKSRICACIISLAMMLALVPAVALTCAQDALAATTPAAGPAINNVWDDDESEYTGCPIPGNIERFCVNTITFTNTKTIPASAAASCDASEAKDSSVICWAIDTGKVTSDGDSIYNLYYGANGVYPSLPKDSTSLFSGLSRLTEIINLDKVSTKNVEIMYEMFSYCLALKSLNLSNFDTSKVTDMSKMFYESKKIQSLDLSSFDTSKVIDMSGMFFECNYLQSLNISSFDTSKVTDMSNMFYACKRIEKLDLKNFNTSAVDSMLEMFEYCYNLETVNVSSFDTSNVTAMEYMFYDCCSLKSLNLSNFDTSNVDDMDSMFYDCASLKSIDLSNFKGDKVRYTCSMFAYCTNLTSVNLSHFNTPALVNANEMFEYCYFLKSVNIASLDSTSLAYCNYMFEDCAKLEAIYASNEFKLSSDCETEYMFSNTAKIKGEKGTTYDYDYESDGSVAKVDGGEADPGYFRLAKPETLTLAKNKYAYSGKAITPKLTVKCGDFVLKQGVDYKVSYSGNTANVGVHYVKVTGAGVYSAITLSKSFIVKPKTVSFKKFASTKNTLKVKWKKNSKANASGIQIQIATNKKFTKNKKTVNVKNYKAVSKKFSKLKSGKKYYVKARIYKNVGGNVYYSTWSKIKTKKLG